MRFEHREIGRDFFDVGDDFVNVGFGQSLEVRSPDSVREVHEIRSESRVRNFFAEHRDVFGCRTNQNDALQEGQPGQYINRGLTSRITFTRSMIKV